MKNAVRWMALAAVVLVSTSATSAWAVWDPDADAGLVFNMNFEAYSNPDHNTVDAKAGLVGTVQDYNSTYPDVFGETGLAGLGLDANFAAIHDNAPGAGVEMVDNVQVSSPNDCKLTVPSNAAFQLGYSTVKHTWTFWFNVPNLNQGTILRHAHMYLAYDAYKNLLWEIRINGGKLQFYHKNNSLRMETASSLTELGLDVNTWHSAAIVIDRSNSIETSVPTTQLSTKIYVDGLEVPVIVTALTSVATNNDTTMNIDNAPYWVSPLWIGAGEKEFDGLLDDVRLYSRALAPVEVSILNQPDKTNPVALIPIPRSENVVITTDVNWSPATGSVTAQAVYFGTDSANLPLKKSGNGSLDIATNAELGGPLTFNTVYYWYVKSTIGGVDSDGPLWSFTTETGKAINPSPLDGAEDVNLTGVDLSWTTPTAATYAVYLSKDRSLVESNDISVRLTDANAATYKNDVDTSIRGAIYYWRINSTYASLGITITGDIWSFRTKPYDLVFNTSAAATTYASHEIPAYTCLLHGDGWSDVATGSLASDGVAVFDFPSGFDYNDRYDIVVVPALRARDIRVVDGNVPQPLAIHVTGNFSFDGRVQISGDDILTSTQQTTYARSGGFPGPKNNQDSSIFGDGAVPGNGDITSYWNIYTFPAGYHGRFNSIGGDKSIYEPTALAKSTFGPGQPVNPPYKGGGGGGSGGIGGEAGRGYFFNVYSSGPSYGDKEVPVPFGGSSGGWGSAAGGGAAGGGGIEIYASGNVVLDSNSQIRAFGGSQLCSAIAYPSGGGGGGCVRIIAVGSVTNKGNINVNGGKGGDGLQTNNTGGGGGGGRVAIFYGATSTYSNTGTITANGGNRGISLIDPCYVPSGLALNGQNGTIFVTNGSPMKASAPTPANGDKMVYCNPDPCTNFQLKWYSGYSGGGLNDVVYCDTFSPPTTSRGSVAANRGQHSVTMTVSSGNTYYWKVVTDGTVSSDTWSFKTVNWRCRQFDGTDPNHPGNPPTHLGGPDWDSNRDCVLNFNDFTTFSENWRNPSFGQYIVDMTDLARFADEWMECYNRTDGGCAGY